MNTTPLPQLPFPLSVESNELLVVITEGRQRRGLTELIAQLALRGPFQLIAGGQWVPDQDDLYTALKQYTPHVEDALTNLSQRRPETHLKMVNMITEIGERNDPLLILDFLNLFYTEDMDISRRQGMVQNCCELLQKARLARPIVVFMQEMPQEDYELLHPAVVSIADDLVQLKRGELLEALLMGKELLSASQLAEKLKTKIQYIGRMVSPENRRITDQFGEWTLKHAVEIHRSTKMAPMEATLTMIALEEHIRINNALNELHEFMQEWDRELEQLKALHEGT